MTDTRTPAAKLAAQERASEIMRLKRRGLSFAAIGAQFGITAQRVHTIWKQTLDAIPVSNVEALRAESVERLDDVLARCHGVLDDLNPVIRDGQIFSYKDQALLLSVLKEIRQTEAQRARLLGLDAPVKTENTTTASVRYEVVGVDVGALS